MAKLTRRELLIDSLLATTAAALAADRAGVARADEAPATGRKLGPNDQIRIALLGAGGRGGNHLDEYAKMNDVTIATICDPDLTHANARADYIVKKGRPAPAVVQDLRRVMEDKNIDAVSIATPNHWHSLAAIWAMHAGKDVYVEKPVSHNVHEGRVMVETAHQLNRICQAGTQCRSMQGTIDAIEYVHAGKIGNVKVARGLCYKPRPSIGIKPPGTCPPTVDFNLWLGPAALRPFHQNKFHYNWHWQWDTGNGDIGNQGIHQMDLARYGLNKSGFPNSVIGFGGRLGYVDDGVTPNTHVSIMDYGDSQLIFETRGLKTEPYRGVTIGNVFEGTDGFVALTSYTGGAAFDLDGKLVVKFNGGGNHFRNFIDAMRSRKREDLRGEIEEGHVSSALCHLGNISYLVGGLQHFGRQPDLGDNTAAYETLQRFEQHVQENGVDVAAVQYRMGRKLAIDPAHENFGHDKQANALLFARYRQGFEVPKKA